MSAATLALLAAKATLLLLLATGALLVARRASAAIRHWIAFLALASVLLLPWLPLILPTLDLRVLPAADAGAGAASGGSTLAVIAVALWLLGAALQIARLAHAHARARRLRREAVPLASWRQVTASVGRSLGLRSRVPALAHEGVRVPMVVGVLRPVVVVPQAAVAWTPGHRRAVLIHELAHVRRCDGLTQLLATVAVALYWLHPLAWWMARVMREEREFACDDLVLAQGARPSCYATLLLRLRGFMFEPRAAPLGAVAFGLRTGLKARIESLLGRRSRRLLTADHHFWLASALLAVLLPVAAARPARAERAAAPVACAIAAPPAPEPQPVAPAATPVEEPPPVPTRPPEPQRIHSRNAQYRDGVLKTRLAVPLGLHVRIVVAAEIRISR